MHKKSWAVIDRPYSLGCATVGALYERPRCIFCSNPRGGVDAPSEAKAQTGLREARAREGEASIEDRRNVSAELTPRRFAPPLLCEEGNRCPKIILTGAQNPLIILD